MTDTDLFGHPTPQHPDLTPQHAPDRRVTGDIEDVLAVLRLAVREGYAVTGSTHEQIWRCTEHSTIEPLPRHEADTVHQLLAAGWLTVGGTHLYDRGAVEVTARSVLTPKHSRQFLLRWDSRKRLGQPARGGW